MKSISLNDGTIKKHLLGNKQVIPKAHLHSVCKIRQGKKSCRYIWCLKQNDLIWKFICTKKTPIKKMMDNFVTQKKTTAKGDNCEGLGPYIIS